MIIASAPGKIILFGEHAVVYDKLGIAAAVDKKVRVTVDKRERGIRFLSKDFNLEKSFSKKELFELLEKFEGLKTRGDFQEMEKIMEKDFLSPRLIVIGEIMRKYGFSDIDISVESEIPKNLGSSSATFAAIALAVSKFLNKNLTKNEICNFAYEGDIMAHSGIPSGIDSAIVTYGGYIRYQKSKGILPLNINFKLPLIVVDSGERASTGEIVSFVSKLKKRKPKLFDSILDKLDRISRLGIKALKLKKLEKIGSLMTNYYQELKKLGISTKRLDKIISLAFKNGALGAKPTGGWGGGCCLVLAKSQKEASGLIKIFKDNGFDAFWTKLGVEGVKII